MTDTQSRRQRFRQRLITAVSSSGRWLLRSWWQIAVAAVVIGLLLSFRAERQRKYVAHRRGECYNIYARERTRFNNVIGPEYLADRDVCRVRYAGAAAGTAGDDDACSILVSPSALRAVGRTSRYGGPQEWELWNRERLRSVSEELRAGNLRDALWTWRHRKMIEEQRHDCATGTFTNEF